MARKSAKDRLTKMAFGGLTGDDPVKPPKPSYRRLSNQEMTEWNQFLDFVDKKGLKGSKDLDKQDKNLGSSLFTEFKTGNPNLSIDYDIVPHVQYEMQQQKQWEKEFNARNNNKASVNKDVSKIDGWFGSLTSQERFVPLKVKTVDSATGSVLGVDDMGLMDSTGTTQATRAGVGTTTKTLPKGVKLEKLQDGWYYEDPQSGDMVKHSNFAMGGEVDEEQLAKGMNLGNIGMGLLQGLMPLLEGTNPNAYSKQPLVNASTVRNVSNPYSSFAMGGVAIEAEGEEAIQTPDGQVGMINGPKHEQGGVDMVVPEGTKIYSDRVSIDGVTMTDRKLKREKTLKRLAKLAAKDPTDPLLANTIARTQATTQAEEEKDMAVQNILNGQTDKFADGGFVFDPKTYTGTPPYATRGKAIIDPNATLDFARVDDSTEYNDNSAENPFTTGDMIGMGGNIFNAIAPLLNTLNAAENTKPNINRFLGFGKDAIAANDDAQDLLAQTQANVNTDIDTSVNTQFARNRNSARSVNALRALDAVTTMGSNKAKAASSANYAQGMAGIMDKRGNIEMAIDEKEMTGEAQRDIADKMDMDNMYSNLAENFVNVGNNVQGLGAALNVSHGNQIDRKLLSQLSKYGLTFDEKGNLISTSNG